MNKFKLIGGITCASILLGAVGAAHLKKNEPKKPETMNLSHSISGIDNIKNISTVALINNTNSFDKEIITSDITEKENITFKTANTSEPLDSLKISYRIEKDNFDIIDLGFSQIGNQLFFLAEGLEPAQKISLTINDQSAHKDVPVDWSGKIKLYSLANSKSDVCVGWGSDSATEICHSFETERSAS